MRIEISKVHFAIARLWKSVEVSRGIKSRVTQARKTHSLSNVCTIRGICTMCELASVTGIQTAVT